MQTQQRIVYVHEDGRKAQVIERGHEVEAEILTPRYESFTLHSLDGADTFLRSIGFRRQW